MKTLTILLMSTICFAAFSLCNIPNNSGEGTADPISYIEVSDLSIIDGLASTQKVIGKISNTSNRKINWIAYDLSLYQNGKLIDVNTGVYPCNETGKYGLNANSSCHFETYNIKKSFDSYEIVISRAKFD